MSVSEPIPASLATCPACGSDSYAFEFAASDWYMDAAAGSWSYRCCGGCKSVRAVPQPSDADLDMAYARSYAPYSDKPSLIERLAQPLTRREASKVVQTADSDGLLVDVGCGAGAMLGRLRDAGWNGPMRGVEPSSEAAERAARQIGVQVDVAPIEALPLAPGSASAIVLRHVIEHVRDPLAVLASLHEALAPGGILYLATPDRRALAERAFRRHWHGYDPPRHLYAFTSDGVQAMLSKSSFELVEERWDYAPQMWAASLHHRLADSPLARWANPLSSLFNPFVGAACAMLGLVEVVAHRSTMYGAIARRVG